MFLEDFPCFIFLDYFPRFPTIYGNLRTFSSHFWTSFPKFAKADQRDFTISTDSTFEQNKVVTKLEALDYYAASLFYLDLHS